MSQVNLLPPEILQGQQTRRLTVMVLLGGAIAVALIILFYLVQVGRLGSVQDDISNTQATNATIQTEIADLQHYEDLQVKAQSQEALLASAYAYEASFSGMLMDVSRVVPSEAYLSNLSIAITPPVAATGAVTVTAPTGTSGFIGTMTATGTALGFETLSEWITGLEKNPGWVNPWLSSITQQGDTGDIYTFSSQADLTNEVLTEQGKAGAVSQGA